MFMRSLRNRRLEFTRPVVVGGSGVRGMGWVRGMGVWVGGWVRHSPSAGHNRRVRRDVRWLCGW